MIRLFLRELLDFAGAVVALALCLLAAVAGAKLTGGL